MLDLGYLPGSYGAADVQMFTAPATASNTQWHTWMKPRGKSMVNIICLGGGAGGGGGFTGATTTARGGGGGGGSSGGSRFIGPLACLPDVLYIQVGAGGIGVGSGGGTAGSGVFSYVSIAPSTTASNALLISGNAVPVGGGTGTGAAAGAAGTAGTLATIATCPLAGLGFFYAIGGSAGIIGAAASNTPGTTHNIPVTSVLTMGGGSGAGVSTVGQTGGLINAISGSYLSEMAPSPAAIGADGCGGFMLFKGLFSYCGMGGGSADNAVGGNGGIGGPGSGGGGGGGGTTGGRGGDGGNGLVIFVSW